MKKNAIILAAGRSSSFAPFIYEKPKGLFCVRGEILVERQIRQLNAAGINDIYIVVGYMKEKFFYLEEKFSGVKLIPNNTFATKGNIMSLYDAREYLGNTFIVCADQYFVHNPFVDNNDNNISYRACMNIPHKFNEFAVKCDENNIITDFSAGGLGGLAMVGHAYFNVDTSRKFVEFLDNEINDFGVGNMFWEEFWAKHMSDLPLYAREYNRYLGFEFDCVEDLMRFDAEFLLNMDSKIIHNICDTLDCEPEEIRKIETISAGLTNVSFKFEVKGYKYVYRHPGATSGYLVQRKTEMFSQYLAKEIGVDNSFIKMGDDGFKISHLVENLVPCDFKNNKHQRSLALKYLRKVHNTDVSGARLLIRDFNPVQEGLKLIEVASKTKGDLKTEFAELLARVTKVYECIQNDDFAKNRKKTWCHCDVYEPNFLITKDDDFYLIDWEYSGLNDPAFDLACFYGRYHFEEDMIDEYIEEYLEHKPSFEEMRYFRAWISMAAFYYFCWGLYKGSVGEDDGFFFVTCYRSCLKYSEETIKAYEGVLVS
ncbi:phosphotransferase [bacterium]|nr:phosphotransferase [bacterium]